MTDSEEADDLARLALKCRRLAADAGERTRAQLLEFAAEYERRARELRERPDPEPLD